jgi:hypothetical protein
VERPLVGLRSKTSLNTYQGSPRGFAKINVRPEGAGNAYGIRFGGAEPILAALAALSAIGTALMVMVYAGGHISGHHRYFDVWALSHFWVYLIGDSGRCRACEQRFFCTPIRSRISGSSESRGLWTGGRGEEDRLSSLKLDAVGAVTPWALALYWCSLVTCTGKQYNKLCTVAFFALCRTTRFRIIR